MAQTSSVKADAAAIRRNKIRTYFSKPHNVILVLMGIVLTFSTFAPIIAIVQDEDASKLLSVLMQQGFGVTKLATTGGFLKAGNTTLLLGVDDNRIDEAVRIIESVCLYHITDCGR